jgi:hypothetical protein
LTTETRKQAGRNFAVWQSYYRTDYNIVSEKKRSIVLGALAALVLMSATSCATMATVGGVITPFGLLTSPSVNASRGETIAEYKIWIGSFTAGYEEFLEATKGKAFDVVIENHFIWVTVRAVAKR